MFQRPDKNARASSKYLIPMILSIKVHLFLKFAGTKFYANFLYILGFLVSSLRLIVSRFLAVAQRFKKLFQLIRWLQEKYELLKISRKYLRPKFTSGFGTV